MGQRPESAPEYCKKYYEILKFDLSVCGKIRFLILLKKLTLKRIFSGSVYLYLSGGAHIN